MVIFITFYNKIKLNHQKSIYILVCGINAITVGRYISDHSLCFRDLLAQVSQPSCTNKNISDSNSNLFYNINFS